MGAYINPTNGQTKEEWLRDNATRLSAVPGTLPSDGKAVVCLIDNGFFTAAAIAYSQAELEEFSKPSDHRPKTWWIADKCLLYGVSNLADYER